MINFLKFFTTKANIENLKEFGSDVTKKSAEAISDSFNSTNFNGTTSYLSGAFACMCCLKMVKYNVVPVVTLATCTVATCYTGIATYKSVKEFIKNPTKGLP